MEEKTKEKQNKTEAAKTTTTSSPLLQKSEIDKIENLKKALKEKGDNNPPNKSDVKSQDKINTPNKSQVISQTDQRSTTWTFLVYPDSAPADWINLLKNLHVPFIISPLHDKDVKDETTGELKKPHYHCIVRFRSKKSFSQIKEAICDKINSPIPQPVVDFPMMVRYLVHSDDPDKYQYNIEDIQTYGNIDVMEYIYDKKDYQYEVLKEILDFCQKFDVQEYSTILNYAKDERKTWFPYVAKVFRATIDAYVRSQRYSAEHGTE